MAFGLLSKTGCTRSHKANKTKRKAREFAGIQTSFDNPQRCTYEVVSYCTFLSFLTLLRAKHSFGNRCKSTWVERHGMKGKRGTVSGRQPFAPWKQPHLDFFFRAHVLPNLRRLMKSVQIQRARSLFFSTETFQYCHDLRSTPTILLSNMYINYSYFFFLFYSIITVQ